MIPIDVMIGINMDYRKKNRLKIINKQFISGIHVSCPHQEHQVKRKDS